MFTFSKLLSCRAENKKLVVQVAAGHHVDDDALLKELENDEAPEDDEFLRKCLTGPFPKSAKHLIERNTLLDENLSSPGQPSIIFEAQSEEVIIEIMKTYDKENWKISSETEGSKENLLHFFINRGFKVALSEILGNDLIKEDVKNLCFHKNAANKIPLMTILTQNMEDSALELFRFMESDNVDNQPNQELEKVLSMTDNSKDNIFHMCSSNRQTETLLTICNSSKISKKCIQNSLIQENSNGRTALDLCQDENALLNILSNFDHTTHKLSSTDKEGKNLLHHLARKDFSRAMALLFKKLPSVENRDLILQESSSNGSNVLMTAATYGSRKTLELLLHYISVFEAFSADNDKFDMSKILHHRNAYGKGTLSFPSFFSTKTPFRFPRLAFLGWRTSFTLVKDKQMT